MSTPLASLEMPDPQLEQPPRRSFLKKAAALAIAGVSFIIPTFIATTYILTPLFRRAGTGKEDLFRFVGKTGSLVPGGPPQLFQVTGVKQDAWTTYPGIALGSVFVRMQEDGSLICLNARCTHLGCTVGYQPDRNSYFCPCHTASFSMEGARTNQVPPRNLDQLVAEIRNKDEIWVKFQNYRTGSEKQVPV